MEIVVTILVPVYGVEKYIERCARSLFEQTYKNIEYIFVDDCSPDQSIAILEKTMDDYPERKPYVRIIHHEKNRGLAAARNTAVENCQTEFLMHVDSDDWLEANAVQKLVEEQIKGNYDIVTGNARLIFSNRIEVLRKNEPQDRVALICEYIKPSNTHVVWGRLIRKSLYTDNSIDTIEGYNIGEDHQVTPRLFYFAKSFSFVDDCICNYDCTNQSSYMRQAKTSSKFSNRVFQDIKAFEVLQLFFKKCPNLIYYATVNEELGKYIQWAIPQLVDYHQPKVFHYVWKVYRDIPSKYRESSQNFLNRISMLLKRSYYFYRFKRIVFNKKHNE